MHSDATADDDGDEDHRAEYSTPCDITNPNNINHSLYFDPLLASFYRRGRLPSLRCVTLNCCRNTHSYVTGISLSSILQAQVNPPACSIRLVSAGC